jgi:8-oxo-dGTP diphosphatase
MKKFTGKTSTAIIPYPGGNILLIKRNTIPFKGYWALPGGRMDPGEIIEQTIIREVKEETGLDVTIVRKIGEYVESTTRPVFSLNLRAEKSKNKMAKSKKSISLT